MSLKPSIRALQITDMPDVMAVIDACDLFPAEMLAEMTSAFFAGEAKQEYWLTYDTGTPVAIAYCAPERMTQGTWNLLLIAVHPDHQGKGYGKALMQHMEQELTALGERILLVETSGLDSFKDTRHFYGAIGYGLEATIRDFYQAGENKIVFRKELNARGILNI